MAKIEDIEKAEYAMITELWKYMHKYLKKIPLSEADYKNMVDEGNKMAKERNGQAQESLARIITAFAMEIEFIDKKQKEETT